MRAFLRISANEVKYFVGPKMTVFIHNSRVQMGQKLHFIRQRCISLDPLLEKKRAKTLAGASFLELQLVPALFVFFLFVGGC